ncbi:50S ribosomal protein L24 [Candidatus Woesearchaeota archaeon]|nr:50S ribosomal protein L24 [Candidatus Woesearchaeota archaeon]
MRKAFSKKWISSKQPRKQRKYNANSPFNIRQKLMSAHLSEELIKKYKRRNISVKKGDKIIIMRGQFKGKLGLINKVNLRKLRIYVDGAEIAKKDGTKSFYPIHPSNVLIKELNLEDKERKKSVERLITK